MTMLAIFLVLATGPVAFHDAIAQMEAPVCTRSGGRVHTRWALLLRDAACAVANACVVATAACAGPIDEATGLVAIVGCGTVAAMSVVNTVTFLLNRDQQIRGLRWKTRTNH